MHVGFLTVCVGVLTIFAFGDSDSFRVWGFRPLVWGFWPFAWGDLTTRVRFLTVFKFGFYDHLCGSLDRLCGRSDHLCGCSDRFRIWGFWPFLVWPFGCLAVLWGSDRMCGGSDRFYFREFWPNLIILMRFFNSLSL